MILSWDQLRELDMAKNDGFLVRNDDEEGERVEPEVEEVNGIAPTFCYYGSQ